MSSKLSWNMPNSNCRNSHQNRSARKGILRNLTKFKGKHLCQSLFFNKVARLRRPFYRTPIGNSMKEELCESITQRECIESNIKEVDTKKKRCFV